MMELWRDIRYGIRALIRSPGFTLVAVLTLALGIGANSTIFTFVNTMLLDPLPYQESDRLVYLNETMPSLDDMSIAYPNFLDWREQNQVFEDIGAFRFENYNLISTDRPERLQAMQASASLFAALKVQAALGRAYTDEEDQPGAPPVVVLSHAFWQRRFGGDPALLGQTVNLSGQEFTVVGVMPPDFNFPNIGMRFDIWVPLGLRADKMQSRGNHPGIYAVARLKPGATLDGARADMNAIAARLEEQYPATNSKHRVGMVFFQERLVQDLRPALLVLMAAVVFVLLIACANLANLLMARATARKQEMAIRSALGAGRRRIVRQLLTESLLLALGGGVFGFLIAIWGTDFMVALIPGQAPRLSEIHVDASILIFSLVISVLTGVFFGLIPALQAARVDMNEMLKEGGRSLAGGFGRHYTRKFLVVAEVALAIFLLVGAGLMMRSFLRSIETSPGFDPSNVLTLRITLPEADYPDNRKRMTFFRQLNERINAIPSVALAGFSNQLLGGSQTSYYAEGATHPAPGEVDLTDIAAVSSEYLRAMGVPLLKGRFFTEREQEDAARVVIVDTTMVERFWPDQDPIGKRLRFDSGPDSDAPWFEIVGVVGHVKNYGVDQESRVECYVPFQNAARASGILLIRSTVNPEMLSNAVREEVRRLDSTLPVYDVRTLESHLAESLTPRRLGMQLLGLFALLALVLAAVGIYGVFSYTVTQSTHEIGIRMALGARRGQVVVLVLKNGTILAALGALIGLALSVGSSPFMASLLFGVGATDPITLVSVPLLLLLVALLACLLPAMRATRVDPIVALRYE